MLWPTLLQMPKTWCKTLSPQQNMVFLQPKCGTYFRHPHVKLWEILHIVLHPNGWYYTSPNHKAFYVEKGWYYAQVKLQNILSLNGLILP
jgi:hypothetical protein